MGYADDFYTKDNIVGYTGVLDNGKKPPTVYFVHREQTGVVRFGHITQYHNDPLNVGRNRVRQCSVYAITNQEITFTDEDTGKRVTRLVSHECITNESNPDISGLQLSANRRGVMLPSGFREIHPSRQPFILANGGCRPILEKSIDAYQDIKPKYGRPDGTLALADVA